LGDDALTRLQRALSGETLTPPPVWLMRQAGRYLPEYQRVRAATGSFLDLCYNPERATEVTMQPIRRFDFDAAILFSDILVIPDALGRRVHFVKGTGPVLDPITVDEIGGLDPSGVAERLAPVMATVRGIRAELDTGKSLIGFCGAPWTVATYMTSGEPTADKAPARIMAAQEPEAFARLIEVLADASAAYLIEQARAGADTLQVFDSWCGVLGEEGFRRWSLEPMRRIVETVRKAVPDVKIIGFPKGAGLMLEAYVAETGVDGVGIDWTVPLAFARDRLQPHVTVQGNLDPLLLLAGGESLDTGIDAILDVLGAGPLIFNLGHGIVPATPPERVGHLVQRVRQRATR